MNYNHRPYIPHETIAAIATPPGEGGIAVIRISGESAFSIASALFSKPVHGAKEHKVVVGTLRSKSGEKLDQVLLLVMKGPKTFTGEDTVEIQCHGGRLVARKILEAVLEAGARSAKPGEFSFQAFMNHRLDLAQAEAIAELIHAKNEYAFSQSLEQLEGALSKKIVSLQQKLTHIAAILEAWVDFPEEGLEFATLEETVSTLEAAAGECRTLIASFHQGKIIHDGIRMSIVGSPNVGKSSLMNALLGRDRAIVSPIPGTTRDLIEDDLHLGHLHFRLVDTAGIRPDAETIEEEGIRRAMRAIEQSDLILYVCDVTNPPHDALGTLLPPGKTILIWNKIDLPFKKPLPKTAFSHCVELSAERGTNMDSLLGSIEEVIWAGHFPATDEIIITKLRHKESLARAEACLRVVIEGLQQNKSAEFVTFDLRQALNELGMIIGTNVTEDILTEIFSQFCIGK
jgi:tRNA modification GTPase